jgi:hydrogenase expression/formation protein HypD
MWFTDTVLILSSRSRPLVLGVSPLDAVEIARNYPEQEVVFFAVGFETTAPATAMAVYQAKQLGLKNFSLLVAHVLVPPAMEALLSNPDCQIQGFLAAGHVCTMMGYQEYEEIADLYQVPLAPAVHQNIP